MFSELAWNDLWRLVSLKDANTRTVLLGTLFLGISSGVVGTFALLRKRALVGDALSHAALPGICLAFIVIGFKSFFGLLLGASLSGIVAVLTILLLVRFTRIQEDAAIGIVLSSFFGFGVCLSRIIQNHPNGMQAGLESFIFGKAASMLTSDAWAITLVCAVVLIFCRLLFKEFVLLCFDFEFAKSTGWPVLFLDVLLMSCIIAVTMVGLQSVGVVLIIALLITPSAAARFWSDRVDVIVLLSAMFGAISALCGTILSALVPHLPTGPLIVLCAAFFFFLSSLFAKRHGFISRYYSFQRIQRKIQRQNFLRKIFEFLEPRTFDSIREPASSPAFHLDEILSHGENKRQILREIRKALGDGLLCTSGDNTYSLTRQGEQLAREIVRNHRLWELYLITYADLAPSQVDASADRIEHVLPGETISQLEQLLARHLELSPAEMPKSPHSFEKDER